MKKIYTVLLVLLLVGILAVGAVSLVDEDATESQMENRKLASLPEFSWEALLSGDYLAELETYYSDTFPGRELLLGVNQRLNGYYHYSGGGEENNMLVLDFQGGAEMGGQSMPGLPMDPAEPEQPQQPAQPEEPQQPADPKPVFPEQLQPEEPEQTPPEVTVPPEETEPPQQEEPPELPPEEETPPEEDLPPEDPEVDDTENLEYSSAGSVIIVGDRAMDVPYATDSIVESYARAIGNLQNALGDEVRVISLLTPNAAQFYSPKDMHSGVCDQQAMIEHCYETMDERIVTVDAYSTLKKHKDEYIYFRTDHHWTQLGAYYAYTAFCEAVGLEAVELDQFNTGSYEGFLGTMYAWTSQYPQSKVLKNYPDTLIYYEPIVETSARYYLGTDFVNYPGYVVDVMYHEVAQNQSNKYLLYLGGDHPLTVVETDVEGPVCMVLKESYGNAFIPFLTSHYSKIIIVDPREYNREEKPSLKLTDLTAQAKVDDLLVINYPFMVSSSPYVKYLNNLAGVYY